MRLLECPVLQEQEKIMVDELMLVQVSKLDILLLEGSLEILYAMKDSLSEHKSASNCSVNRL